MRMVWKSVHIIGMAAAGLVAAGAAQAQNVQVNRTSDYTASWSGSAFSGASAVYGGSTAWSGVFTGATWTFNVLPGATGLTFNEGDGITITSPSLTPTPPYPPSIVVATERRENIGVGPKIASPRTPVPC